MKSLLFAMLAVSVLLSPQAGATSPRCVDLFGTANGHELIYHGDQEGRFEKPLTNVRLDVYDVGRTAEAIIQGIPQLLWKLLKVEKWGSLKKRPIMIDWGCGIGRTASDFAGGSISYNTKPRGIGDENDYREINTKLGYFNVLGITGESKGIYPGNEHLEIMSGRLSSQVPNAEIHDVIKNKFADPTGLADGGWDSYGIFAYSKRPDLEFIKLNQLLKVDAEFYILGLAEIDPPDGYDDNYKVKRRSGLQYTSDHEIKRRTSKEKEFFYEAGTVPENLMHSKSTVVDADGKIIPLFDYLARIGGFKVEYWNQGTGTIKPPASMGSGLPGASFETNGTVIKLTKISDIQSTNTHLVRLKSWHGGATFMEVRDGMTPEQVLARDKRAMISIGKLIFLDHKYFAASSPQEKYDVLAEGNRNISLFDRNSVLANFPLTYADYFLGLLAYDVPAALKYYQLNASAIEYDPHLGDGYAALYELYAGQSNGPALKHIGQILSEVKSELANNPDQIASKLQQRAIAQGNPYGLSLESIFLAMTPKSWKIPGLHSLTGLLFQNANRSDFSAEELKQVGDNLTIDREYARGWEKTLAKSGKRLNAEINGDTIYIMDQSLPGFIAAWKNLPLAQEWLQQNGFPVQ